MLIAPDSFKGSLSAQGVAEAIAAGIRQATPDAEVHLLPMADGGEGTLDALTAGGGYTRYESEVQGPLGRPVRAPYAVSHAVNRAVVELAAASGLPLVRPEERDLLHASTFGTGQLIRQALTQLRPGGEVLLCVGGSATNDAGTGLLRALGVRWLDQQGRELPEGGGALKDLHSIDLSEVPPQVSQVRWRVACDVTNPLTGPRGAAAVFGPQKGGTPQDIALLDLALTRFAAVVAEQCGRDILRLPGGGAAGGTAAGLAGVLNAELQAGCELVAEASGLQARLRDEEWDLIWTGEGQLDHQSAHGKVVSGVASLAQQRGLPVIALAGAVQAGAGANIPGLTAAFALAPGPLTLAESQRQTSELLTRQSAELTRLWCAGRKQSQRV